MIDFLNECVDINTINEIKNNNNENILSDIECNKEDCLKIINYFKELGITCIDNLLIYELDVFKYPFDEIIKKFGKFNIPMFVSVINDDYAAIENIFKEIKS